MVSYLEFAKQIKEKYPEYADVDDLKLAQAMVEKYPEYVEQVEFDTTSDTPIEKSPLSIADRVKMGFGDVEGNLKYLQEKYGKDNVKMADSGTSYLIKTDKGWQKSDPKGMNIKNITDLPADVLEILLPTAIDAAAQAGGVTVGGLSGNVPGAIAGAAGGAAAGNAINQGIGNALGVRDGFNAGEDILSAVLGGVIPAVAPVGAAAKNAVGNAVKASYNKVGRPVLNALAKPLMRLPIRTIEQAVKPTSKALDMDEIQTQDALKQLTQQVGKQYDAIKEDKENAIHEVINSIQKDKKTGTPLAPELQPRIKQADLLRDLEDLYFGASFSGDPNATRYIKGKKSMDEIAQMLDDLSDANMELSAPKLYDVMSRIKGDVKWNTTSENEDAVNEFLKRVYGAYSERLKQAVPRIKKPFKEYQDLMNLRNSEGVKQIIQNYENDKTALAASALKNQGRIINQGMAKENIAELENMFKKYGFDTFSDKIDDINAAQELNKTLMTGDSGWQGFIRETLGKGSMSAARKFNRSNVGQKLLNETPIEAPAQNPITRAYQSVLYALTPRKMITGGVVMDVDANGNPL